MIISMYSLIQAILKVKLYFKNKLMSENYNICTQGVGPRLF